MSEHINPKQLKAVALAYEKSAIAPRVVGQGEGYLAQAILDKAKELGIPTRVEPDLVEFLMQLRLNDFVPPQLYAAVAEVIAWAHQVDGKIETPRKQIEETSDRAAERSADRAERQPEN